MAKSYGIKTVDENGQRLIWWKEAANEAHWHDRFIQLVPKIKQLTRTQRNNQMVRLIEKYMPPTGQLLEAGCGAGWLVKLLREDGFDAEGVDYSQLLIEAVKASYPDLPVRFGDVTKLDVPDNTYAGYISIGVIEHRQEGCDIFLREAKRITAPNGRLFISVPYYSPLRKLLHRSRNKVENDLEFYQFGFQENFFQKAIESAGLKFIRFEYYGLQRGLYEELPTFTPILQNRYMRRFIRMLEQFGVRFGAHMIVAIAEKP